MPIVDIKHKGLRELFENGRTRRMGKEYQARTIFILDLLHKIKDLDECKGIRNFHPLVGDRKGEYAMSVSGNYRITFEFEDGDVTINDFEDYH
jgi:proteic killer suppression protein